MPRSGIIPGEPGISIIAAEQGTAAATIIEGIAKEKGSQSTPYAVGDWRRSAGGHRVCDLKVTVGTEVRPVILQIGGTDGLNGDALVIKDSHQIRKNGLMRVVDGKTVLIHPGRLAEKDGGHGDRVRSLAFQIVGSAIGHGVGWTDSRNNYHESPFGGNARVTSVRDALSFCNAGTLSANGLESKPNLTVSPHVGDWQKSETRLVPIVAGIRALMHEYRADGAHPNSNVGCFKSLSVSDDRGIWGPYMTWSSRPFEPRFGKLSEIASSPFAFHVAATRQLFPNTTLTSTAILNHFGEDGLRQILERLIEIRGRNRFYRLIDEEGLAHRLVTRSQQGPLVYGETQIEVDPNTIVANVVDSFKDLAELEADPAYRLERRRRLVLDDAAYIAFSVAMTQVDGVAETLSGSQMADYLFTGQTSQTNRLNASQVYTAIRHVREALPEKATLKVYVGDWKTAGSQYDISGVDQVRSSLS